MEMTSLRRGETLLLPDCLYFFSFKRRENAEQVEQTSDFGDGFDPTNKDENERMVWF